MKGILALGLLAQLAAVVMDARAQSVVEYIHTDALGSVVAITDANQRVVHRRISCRADIRMIVADADEKA